MASLYGDTPVKNANGRPEEFASLLSEWSEDKEKRADAGARHSIEIEDDISAAHQGIRPMEQNHLLVRPLLLVLLGLRYVYNLIATVLPVFPKIRSGATRRTPLSDRKLLLSYIKAIILFLLPSPVRCRFFPTEEERKQPAKILPTGFLDGLRGTAALAVFLYHFSNNIYGNLQYSYGAPPSPRNGSNENWVQLPIVKVLFSGPAAVCVFFVVSGFALSVRPVAQMRSHDDAGLMRTLGSSVFRRAFRLFLPCIFSTLIVFLCVRMGLFDLTRFVHDHKDWMTGRHKLHLRIEGTFAHQFWDWFGKAKRMIKPFYWSTGKFQGYSNNYDAHLWTIAIEFRASLALYLTQAAVARLRPTGRMLVLALLAYYGIKVYRWEMVLFWIGTILAELHAGFLSPNQLRDRSKRFRMIWWATFLIALFIGLYLVSFPDKTPEASPGYRWLTRQIPRNWEDKRRWWQGWGAVLVVLSVQSLPPFARFMGSGFPRYLGKISFALYLMHGLCNRTVGYTCLYIAWQITGRGSRAQILLGFLLAGCFHIPITFWIADLFWRCFDIPTQKFSKWLEEILTRVPKPPERNGNLEVRN